MQATVWVSDTSAMCKMSGGVDGSMVVAMSAGGRAGSLTESASFDGRMASSLAGTNEGSSGGGSLSVSGADFGTSRCRQRVRMGQGLLLGLVAELDHGVGLALGGRAYDQCECFVFWRWLFDGVCFAVLLRTEVAGGRLHSMG